MNNISAIHNASQAENVNHESPQRVDPKLVSNDLLSKIKTLITQNSMNVIWNDIENIFINVENPKSLPNSTIKAGKALCYSL